MKHSQDGRDYPRLQMKMNGTVGKMKLFEGIDEKQYFLSKVNLLLITEKKFFFQKCPFPKIWVLNVERKISTDP